MIKTKADCIMDIKLSKQTITALEERIKDNEFLIAQIDICENPIVGDIFNRGTMVGVITDIKDCRVFYETSASDNTIINKTDIDIDFYKRSAVNGIFNSTIYKRANK
jgi:hypothetical protein